MAAPRSAVGPCTRTAAPGGFASHRNTTDASVLADTVLKRWMWGAAVANGVGGGAVFAFLTFAAPILLTAAQAHRLQLRSAVAMVVFFGVVVPILVRMRQRWFRSITGWLREGRAPTEQERRVTLQAPGNGVRVAAGVWGGGAVLFGAMGATEAPSASLYIFLTVLLAGASTCAVWYLIVERIMRPVSARALIGEAPERPIGPGIQARFAMAWTLPTAVPLLGIVTLAFGYLADFGFAAQRTFAAILILVAISLTLGLFTILVAARSLADRVSALRDAFADLEAGDFVTRVVVDDASEVGRLQVGFNRVAAGLAEREHLRETFGTYVDPGVAEHILRETTGHTGEEVEVTIMFVDVRDFTSFAESSPAPTVVATLNRLFARIVPLVYARGGHIDKYIGDGLLAVFGAPRRLADHADQALRAALDIAEAVRESFDGALSVGIGLNSGPVVAGSVGGAGRFEFSVIGDAVNVAARVESATRQTGDVILLTGDTRAMLTEAPVTLSERGGVQLRGRRSPVDVFAALPDHVA
ncbi:adenylate/guanylate cyclase domain-containing protein [Mycolicibacterium litorale]|uniref:adenylate/guanylate cyclase domain-containing protein n=1 Tax=Mycolicibacterium litorale TaxID=758802 RepID=UPI003CEBD124